MRYTDNIKHNKARCKLCNETIESIHRHDYISCTCGAIAVDGGKSYLRRAAKDFDSLEELSEYYTVAEWKKHLKYLESAKYKEKLEKYNQQLMASIWLGLEQ